MVALKVFTAKNVKEDSATLARLHHEASIAGLLRHPHVIKVYEIGAVQETFYLAMQYCSGGSLADVLLERRFRPCWAAAASIARQIGAALHHVHGRGIVHADVQPGNILFNERGRALLSDFGLSALLGARIQSGTPGYAAPEQLAGEPVDHRADVYGLAAVIVSTLTGVFMSAGRPLNESRLLIDAPLRARRALTRALAPAPARRMPSVRDLLAELEA